MKSLLITGLSMGLATANIIFNHVPLKCDPKTDLPVQGLTGCLRGQLCTDQGTCKRDESASLYVTSFSRAPKAPNADVLAKRAFSTNGQCGSQNGGLTCDPNGSYGPCCSSYGWCGSTAAHCGDGCQSGCKPTTADPTAPRPDGRCGSAFGGATCDPAGAYGGCCSSYGYCGKTDGHCLVANGCQSGCTAANGGTTATQATTTRPPTSTSQEPVLGSPSATGTPNNGVPTKDGSCGAANGGTVCGSWPQGGCCSMYGCKFLLPFIYALDVGTLRCTVCGNTAAHCGQGCQSGPCVGAPVVPAPGPSPAPKNPNGGSLTTWTTQAGVPAMHAGLMPNGKVIFLDKVENYTQIKLANGQYAYSAEYDPVGKKVVGLQYKTNAFCSGGMFLPDGRWASLGGNGPLDFIDPTVGDGFRSIRTLSRPSDGSKDGQPWVEDANNKLSTARWYATAQTLANGNTFVASGSLNGLDPTVAGNNNPTWELLDPSGKSNGKSVNMTILVKNQPYYMYPFIHLMKDGNLFVMVAKSAESFNVATNKTITSYPDLPGDYRTYPNTGGSVLLPLTSANQWNPDVVICGGGAYQDINSPTEPSCGRIQPLATGAKWEMDSMPEGRGMVEGTLLPDGTVVWVNGANSGAQGFGVAKNPTYEVLLYDPTAALGKRWSTGPTSTIARLYHSVALLLLDGTLMIAGSNPVEQPILTPVPGKTPSEDYITEFRVENYVPPYLSGPNATKRPTAVALGSKSLKVGTTFTVTFTAPTGNKAVKVALYHGGFVTHSVHMNHRMAFLDTTGYKAGATAQSLTVSMPPNGNVAPPGPYVVYVVVDGVPAVGQFVSVA